MNWKKNILKVKLCSKSDCVLGCSQLTSQIATYSYTLLRATITTRLREADTMEASILA